MRNQDVNGLPVWKFEKLLGYPETEHFITTRHGGYSQPPFGSFNLSYRSGENINTVTKNRELLSQRLNTNLPFMYFPEQCHTSNIKVIKKASNNEDLAETDALVTDIPGYYLCVLVADCLPILLFDPVKHVVGAVHAGWRGTVDGITKKTIRMFTDHFASQASNIIACIGPCISAGKYQVGPEVIAQVKTYFGTIDGLVTNIDKNGRGYLDLRASNRWQLLTSGMELDNIEISDICTFQNTETFYSARKEGRNSGRFACGISLNNSFTQNA